MGAKMSRHWANDPAPYADPTVWQAHANEAKRRGPMIMRADAEIEESTPPAKPVGMLGLNTKRWLRRMSAAAAKKGASDDKQAQGKTHAQTEG